MSKKTRITRRRDPVKAARVRKTATVTGVTERMVYMVIQGDRKNDTVLDVYMQIEEGENLLLEAVKKAVPFN